MRSRGLPDSQTRTAADSSSREKTLLASLLLSAPGPLVTGIAMMTSQSTTQLADFLRRSMELAAIFISWWVFRKLHRNEALGKADQAKTTVDLCVTAALAAVAIAPAHPATRYIDILGSIVVAVYLLWSGLRTAQNLPALGRQIQERSTRNLSTNKLNRSCRRR